MDFIEEGKFEFFSDIFDKAKELKHTEQKQIIEEKRPSAPVRQWDTGKKPIPTTPAKKGWNNLKM